MGLSPTRSAIFVGPPGVGKTLTARWLASQLGVPLYVLDLTAVMSSLLGRSGTNLRAALDFAKRSPCVLLLDEIDAIAKRRSDDTDIGELKRLVTVILQEVDEWPATGLLLAATNHAELIDPALWRRFDLVITSKRRKCRLSSGDQALPRSGLRAVRPLDRHPDLCIQRRVVQRHRAGSSAFSPCGSAGHRIGCRSH